MMDLIGQCSKSFLSGQILQAFSDPPMLWIVDEYFRMRLDKWLKHISHRRAPTTFEVTTLAELAHWTLIIVSAVVIWVKSPLILCADVVVKYLCSR